MINVMSAKNNCHHCRNEADAEEREERLGARVVAVEVECDLPSGVRCARGAELWRAVRGKRTAANSARLTLLRRDELVAAMLAHVAACRGVALVGGGRGGEARAEKEQDSQDAAARGDFMADDGGQAHCSL